MSVKAAISLPEGVPLDLGGAFIRRTNLDRAVLTNANLTRADLTGASVRDADLEGARLTGAILNGADFSGAKNLTVDQLAEAVIDDMTRLPDYIGREALIERMTSSRK